MEIFKTHPHYKAPPIKIDWTKLELKFFGTWSLSFNNSKDPNPKNHSTENLLFVYLKENMIIRSSFHGYSPIHIINFWNGFYGFHIFFLKSLHHSIENINALYQEENMLIKWFSFGLLISGMVFMVFTINFWNLYTSFNWKYDDSISKTQHADELILIWIIAKFI